MRYSFQAIDPAVAAGPRTEGTTVLRITIDGPAGAGKSTVARELAQLLGYTYLDTGAMYRALALSALREGVDSGDEPALAALLSRLDLRFERGRIRLGDEDVADEIRAPAVDRIVSLVAAHPRVREAFVARQRALAGDGGVVVDGRDAGTVVLPDAECKFFLTASLDARADRRHRELLSQGLRVSIDEVRREMAERDALDEMRSVGALRVPEGALLVDTTGLSVVEVVRHLAEYCRVRGA
ncbi:MAG: (d)CMP kinase [Thermaerobacter sp.]|nr:(d)CMP kinase [Thermaerobacter sp.]